ncbi:uncharacterized protein LOC116955563 [Petromyzon marinus]|uniref:uncharacterized protein LOC116955563 n=1 Tax=Petromyzon marinus TaxID=7757 RepID=UPI003F6FD4C4
MGERGLPESQGARGPPSALLGPRLPEQGATAAAMRAEEPQAVLARQGRGGGGGGGESGGTPMWQAGHQDAAQRQQQQQVEQLLRLQNEQQQQRILGLLSSAFARPGSGFPVSFPVGFPSDLTSLAFSTAMPQFNPFSLLAAAGAHLPTMMHQQQQQQEVLSASTMPPFGLPTGAHSENASISSSTSANRTPELSWWALKYLSSQADGDGERGAPSVGSASSSDRNEWRPATHGAARPHAEDADTTLDESIPEDDTRASGVAQGRPWRRGRHGEAQEQRSAAAQKPPPYAEDRPIRPGVVGRRTTFEEFVEEQLKLQEARGAAHKARTHTHAHTLCTHQQQQTPLTTMWR